MKGFLVPLAVLLIMSSLALAEDGDAPDKQPDKFKITTRREDDAVAVRAGDDKVVFAVKSLFGISQAVIEWLEGDWPGPWCCGCT